MPTPTTDPTASESQIFEVGAEMVWDFRADFANLPDYNPDVTDIERIVDGAGVGDECGAGARYRFQLADPRRPGVTHPVELWTVEVVKPTLVVAGMQGGNEAYEEFVVEPIGEQGCRATLSLWVSLPDDLPSEVIEKATTASRQQLRKEL
ncbi:MAG TPA: SRPBCC family protein, partial [Acidimicrobiales bacterium]